MDIKVNVVNEMRRIKNTAYSDRLTWIDELVQNGQRSRAKNIKITLQNNYGKLEKIIIEDDGVGCTNPENLFIKSTSGWDSEITQLETPFGEGFFSTIMVANNIEVESVGFTANFDVNRMFSENTTDVVEIMQNDRKSGFVITLTDINTDRYSSWSIENRIQEVGRYIKSPRIFLNGKKVAYEGTEPKVARDYMRKINTPHCKGWIYPDEWAYIRYFAFDRLVKKDYGSEFRNFGGVLTIKPGTISLRSPDRKDFIHDEEYDIMISEIKDEIKKICINIMRTGTDEDIKKYESQIEANLSVDEYQKYTKFEFLGQQKESSDEECEYNDDESSDINTYTDDEYDSNMGPQDDNDSNTDTQTAISSQPTVKRGRPRIVSKQTGSYLKDNIVCGFYVDEENITEYKDEIEIAHRYNLPVAKIRNKLEKLVMERCSAFQDISDIRSMIETHIRYDNTSPASNEEEDVLSVLEKTADALNLDDCQFIIADAAVTKTISANGETITLPVTEQAAYSCDDYIIINRSFIKTDPYAFVLANLLDIASALSVNINNTKIATKEHSDQTMTYMADITKFIVSECF